MKNFLKLWLRTFALLVLFVIAMFTIIFGLMVAFKFLTLTFGPTGGLVGAIVLILAVMALIIASIQYNPKSTKEV